MPIKGTQSKLAIKCFLLDYLTGTSYFSELPRTVSLLQGIQLKRASGPVWKKSFEGQLSEQNIFDNFAANLVSIVRSVAGWLAIELFRFHRQFFMSRPESEKSSVA